MLQQENETIPRRNIYFPTYDVSCFIINPLFFLNNILIHILFSESFIWSFDRILKNLIAKKLTILEKLNLIFI